MLRPVDEGGVILDSKSGKYWHLDQLGVRLVQLLEEGHHLEDYVRWVTSHMRVDAATARHDAKCLWQTLRESQLVEGVL